MAFRPIHGVEQTEAGPHTVTASEAISHAAADAYKPHLALAASQGERSSKMDAVLKILPPVGPGGEAPPAADFEIDDYTLRLGGRMGDGARRILPHRYE